MIFYEKTELKVGNFEAEKMKTKNILSREFIRGNFSYFSELQNVEFLLIIGI